MIRKILNIGEGERYYRFANADNKVWIMPARHLRTAMELYQPSGIKGKMLKRWFPLLHQLPPVRGVIHAETMRCRLNDNVQSVLEKAFNTKGIEYAIFCGTPSIHQKVTMQISKGRTLLGYCKISDHNEIATLFEKEAKLLAELKKKGIRNIPECLYCGSLDDGITLFVQSTEKTLASETVHHWDKIHGQFLTSMRDATTRCLKFEDSDYYHTLEALTGHYDWMPTVVDKTLVEKTISKVFNRWCGKEVVFSAYHADFTPWNIFVENGRLFVFDWEYAQTTYPPMLDRYHFFTQTAIFERKWKEDDFYRYISSDEGRWINGDDYTAYLIDIIARFTVREKGHVGRDIVSSMKLWSRLLLYLDKKQE